MRVVPPVLLPSGLEFSGLEFCLRPSKPSRNAETDREPSWWAVPTPKVAVAAICENNAVEANADASAAQTAATPVIFLRVRGNSISNGLNFYLSGSIFQSLSFNFFGFKYAQTISKLLSTGNMWAEIKSINKIEVLYSSGYIQVEYKYLKKYIV